MDDNGDGTRTRVGLLVPSSNTVMEPDLAHGLPDDVTVHTGRMLLDEVTGEAEARMLDDEALPAARALATAEPHVVVFGCTSAGALRGLDADAQLCARIGEATHAPTVSVIAAVRARIRELGTRRLAVATPYTPELTERVRAALDDLVEVVATTHLGLTDNRQIGDTDPARVADFVADGLGGTAADAVFVSCTNLRAVEALDEIERRMGVPATSSNDATLRAVRSHLSAH